LLRAATEISSLHCFCRRYLRYQIPFCVSSYSSLASRHPTHFLLLLPRDGRLLAMLVATIGVEVAALYALGRWMRHRHRQRRAACNR